VRLTDKAVAALKPKPARYEVWEGYGFGVRVTPRGAKSWVLVYRFQGRPRRLTIGTYPAIGLADARIKSNQARKLVELGKDPGAEIVVERRAEREADTVAELVDDYLAKWARPRKRSAGEDERILFKDVVPVWGRSKAKDITRRDVVALLDRIAARGAPIGANRTLAIVRRMFNWGVSRDLVAANPCNQVRGPGEERQRDRVLKASEIAAFWNGLDDAAMSAEVRSALRLLLVTGQRRGEVVSAAWEEIDADNNVWTIPGGRSKNALPHRVPLSRTALDLLRDIRAAAGQSKWLFPSPRGDKPISGPAVDHALRRCRGSLGLEGVTPHDLRRTAASTMASMGTSRLVVSRILNHVERGVTAVYDRYGYDNEKREALNAWGQRLEQMIGRETEANVMPIGSGSIG